MNNKGIAKSTIIIIISIIAVIIGIFIIINGEKELEYFRIKSDREGQSCLIQDYKTLKNIIKKGELNGEMTNILDFNKYSITDHFNEEYFNEKKIAMVVTYEDTSKSYIYSIDKVTYNSDKTEATVYYTDKTDGYAGTLGNCWYNYMFVEVENTVEKVNFVVDNGSES